MAIHGCLWSLWATRYGMSKPERRKQRKAQKERLQAKKESQHTERWRDMRSKVIAGVGTSLRDAVTSGKVCIAVATTVKFRALVAAMWEHDGVQVRTYSLNDMTSMTTLAAAAEELVGRERWAHFIEGHLKAAVDIDDDEYALSGIEWPSGKGPKA